jgi:ubiquinone/menaquinone biosynthesis C-methylase UbiE
MITDEKLYRWYDFQAPFYRLWRNRYDSPLVDEASRRLAGRPRTRQLLDAATGTGLMAIGLGRLHSDWSIQALDASRGVLRVAERQAGKLGLSNVGFCQGNVTRLPFPSERYDAVVVAGLIPYLNTPRVALEEFHRVLRPDGLFLSLEFDRAEITRGTRLAFNVMITGYRVFSTLLPRFRFSERWDVESSTIDPEVYESDLAAAGFHVRDRARRHRHWIYELTKSL